MKKRFLVALLILFFLSTFNSQENFNFLKRFNIKVISIENNFIVSKKVIKKKISFLYDTNLFFLKTKKIESKLEELDFIDSFKIKKIYPNKVIIKIFEKKPVAIIQNKKEKKYFTEKGQLINFFDFERYEDLPIVFGDGDNFKNFYSTLLNINFPINEINKFYLFETNRWDIVTNQNQTIKLPIKGYIKSLQNFISIKNKVDFKKYRIFDYRIKDQLILK